MKISLVGCGGISRSHFQAIKSLPDCELVAVADIIEERAKRAADETGAKAYTDLDSLLNNEKFDVLHICTPHYLHADMALKALDRGIHVLIEKPCAVSREELETLRAKQKETGLKVGVCFQNRYNESTEKLMEELAKPETGKLLGLRGFVTWQRGEAYYSDDWHGTLDKECGGVLINQAIHTLDLMQRAGGGIESLLGHIANDHLQGIIEVEDTATILMDFKEGAKGIFYATLANYNDAPIIIDFICENVSLRLEGDNLYKIDRCGTVESLHKFDDKPLYGKACWGSGHTALIADFYDSIKEGRPFEIDAFVGGKALEAVLSVYESAKSGERVAIEKI